MNLTISQIRDQVRNRHYDGDMFKAIVFLLNEYDLLWSEYRKVKTLPEYTVVTSEDD